VLVVTTLEAWTAACSSQQPPGEPPEAQPAVRAEPEPSPSPAELARMHEEHLESVEVPLEGAVLASLPARGEAPEPLVVATPVSPLGIGREVVYSIESLRFPIGVRAIQQSSREVLDQLADRLALGDAEFYLEVQGHADGSGPEFENERLAALRAEAVRSYLLDRTGLPEDRTAVVSLGSTQPIGDDRTAFGRGLNRRVVVLVLR
jgi:outer membrane protein OmpA-like peptidoglycan-associated protein